MATLPIDISGVKGLSTRFFGDMDRTVSTPNLRYMAQPGQMVDGIWNPFRRLGYLSPANSTFVDITAGSTPFTQTPASVLYDDVNDAIIWAERGQIPNFLSNGLDDTSLTYDSDIDPGSTGTPVIFDLEMYSVNAVRKAFLIYEKSGNIHFAHFTPPDNAITEVTAMNSVAVNRTLFARVADNGFMYIFSDNAVHKFDGTSSGGGSGTSTLNVLTFPVTFTITDAIDYGGYFFVGIIQAPITPANVVIQTKVFNLPCGVYVWNRQSTVLGTADFIPLYGVRAILKMYTTQSGALRIMTISSEGVLEIREYNGRTFQVIQEVGRNAHPNFHDSVTQVGGLTIWWGANGIFYAHGTLAPGMDEALYKIGNFTGTFSQTGAIFFGGANTDSTTAGYKAYRSGLIIGYNSGSSTGILKQWDFYGTGADGGTSFCLQGDAYSPIAYLPELSTLQYIDIYMAPSAVSGSTVAATVKIYLNQSTTVWASKSVTRNDIAKGYIQIPINKPYVNSVQIEIEYATDVSVDVADFAPSLMVVGYEPTKTRS